MLAEHEGDDDPEDEEQDDGAGDVGHLCGAGFLHHAVSQQRGWNPGRDGAQQGAQQEGAVFDMGYSQQRVGNKAWHGENAEQDHRSIGPVPEVRGNRFHPGPVPQEPGTSAPAGVEEGDIAAKQERHHAPSQAPPKSKGQSADRIHQHTGKAQRGDQRSGGNKR